MLVPAAGILDVLDNYAFVRTSGYLPGTDDVYVSLSMVRKYGLRRGDAIVGQVRQPREGERKEKFNPMVRIDSVNGADPETAKNRVEFAKLTPLYPSRAAAPRDRAGQPDRPGHRHRRADRQGPARPDRLAGQGRQDDDHAVDRQLDHDQQPRVPPDGGARRRAARGGHRLRALGQGRGHLLDVRPAGRATTRSVAELAIERAKRLVELGHDVVVLLDGITRLGRAYNLAAPASGRILSGGVDSAALYPPKKFFGAARNIENGGSLTILATALIESGSKMDEVIFEEFKGTGNMEIRLRRDFADKRLFPAIDAVQSGTRREELPHEQGGAGDRLEAAPGALRARRPAGARAARWSGSKKSQTNIEFLMQVQKTTPSADGDD